MGEKIEKYCSRCSKKLNTWDLRVSRTLAYKYPACEGCIADEYGMDTAGFRRRMEHYFDIRPCLGP